MSSESLLKPSPLIPVTRTDIVQSLIDGVDRYNPDNVSILEDYLGQQLQNEEYDLMANLAILKFITKLTELQQCLEQARFREFWEIYGDESCKELASEAIGFEDAIRKVNLLSSYLNYNPEFESFIQNRGLEIKEEVVYIPKNADNDAKPTVIRENIKFERT
ncbi:5026_t:CDS:2 [Diversispora eburnea]|uniref:5026_t:CDS:1 n=1 Tax=Diversispora eburnea TaxID=1213867 RepID=A0A9N8YTT3_9GLOM|nr:5026_t:CDS:2 [Diversispora eburnea]